MATDRAAARTLAPNALIDAKYSLVRRLAKGGMGDVWLARNEKTEAFVALKVLRPPGDQKSEMEDRFRREARLAGLLAHRSIVRIFDFIEEPDGTLVLVMELLRGETLEQWLMRKGALPTREAMAVMAAVLSALQHGHEQGIIHRDVKPSNIFLSVDPDGRVIPKLLDYGIAKMPRNDRSKTMDGVVLGTPSYMSPEQIRSEPDLDGRSDLFACAVVLYETLTGVCPFQATTPSAAIAAVLQSSVDPDPRIEPRLWLEVQRAFSKRPKQRHESAAAMRAAMLTALGETEDSLASALQGVTPNDGSHSGMVPVFALHEAHTQSVEGQSVAAVHPLRRGGSWVAWAAVGAIVGSVVAMGAVTRAGPFSARAPVRAAAALGTNPQVAAPSAPFVPPPPAPPATAADPQATQPASTAPLATVVTTAPEVAAAAHVAPSAPRPHHALAKPHAPRPVATSPGF